MESFIYSFTAHGMPPFCRYIIYYTIKQDLNSTVNLNLIAGVEKNPRCGKILMKGGDFLANIKIDNFSGDTVTVFLGEKSETVEDGGKISFDFPAKEKLSLKIHRARVPLESEADQEIQNKTFLEEMQGRDKSLHTPLDYIAKLSPDSSKVTITIKSDVRHREGRGLDAVFASYSLTATGAKIEEERKAFANSGVKKRFLSHHLKNAFFPVGIGGIILLLIAIFSLVFAVSGNPINLGGTVFTIPWALALSAVAVLICVYFSLCVANVMKTAKRLS